MIPAAGIDDQELAIAAEISGIHHPAIGWRHNLGADAGLDGDAALAAAEAVGSAVFTNPCAGHRQLQPALGVLEVKREPDAVDLGLTRRFGGAYGAGDLPFHAGDELAHVLDLLGELLGAAALAFEGLFVVA